MPKVKSQKKNPEETVKKRRNLKNNRKRGCDFERKIAQELRELGYDGVKTTRAESKSLDDKKVDLVDTEGKLPFYCQLKNTIKTPDYFGIRKECPLVDKPFIIF